MGVTDHTPTTTATAASVNKDVTNMQITQYIQFVTARMCIEHCYLRRVHDESFNDKHLRPTSSSSVQM